MLHVTYYTHTAARGWISIEWNATNRIVSAAAVMLKECNSKGCKAPMPPGLVDEGLCLLHYTLHIEEECAAIRRETALGNTSHDRQVELFRQIVDRGDVLVSVATSGFTMSDEMKARVLSTLLTLMNTRENMDRSAMRQSAMRRFA